MQFSIPPPLSALVSLEELRTWKTSQVWAYLTSQEFVNVTLINIVLVSGWNHGIAIELQCSWAQSQRIAGTTSIYHWAIFVMCLFFVCVLLSLQMLLSYSCMQSSTSVLLLLSLFIINCRVILLFSYFCCRYDLLMLFNCWHYCCCGYIVSSLLLIYIDAFFCYVGLFAGHISPSSLACMHGSCRIVASVRPTSLVCSMLFVTCGRRP